MFTPREVNLQGLRVLVVEDTLLVADLLVEQLQDAGCIVVGPVPRVERGLAIAEAEVLDGALLDINLAGKPCFPIADVLIARGVPIAFLTGYGEDALPARYRNMPRLSKPFQVDDLIEMMERRFAKS